jgi:hypothetical protein
MSKCLVYREELRWEAQNRYESAGNSGEEKVAALVTRSPFSALQSISCGSTASASASEPGLKFESLLERGLEPTITTLLAYACMYQLI